jgi:hypothetical protein
MHVPPGGPLTTSQAAACMACTGAPHDRLSPGMPRRPPCMLLRSPRRIKTTLAGQPGRGCEAAVCAQRAPCHAACCTHAPTLHAPSPPVSSRTQPNCPPSQRCTPAQSHAAQSLRRTSKPPRDSSAPGIVHPWASQEQGGWPVMGSRWVSRCVRRARR